MSDKKTEFALQVLETERDACFSGNKVAVGGCGTIIVITVLPSN
jgi:hypothetical protein